MKVGYPDTINNKAYQDKTSASPFKMVDKSKADLDKDGKVSEYESKRADAAFGETPLNMNGPLYARNKYTSFGEGEKYGPPSDEDKLPGQPDKHDDRLLGLTEPKPDESDKSDKPGKVSTKTTRIVKSGGGTGGSTVGREVVKGIKKLVDKRKKRRAANPKVEQRKIGRDTRKANKEENKKNIKTEKAKVTTARQDKRTAKATIRQTKRLDKVTKKVVKKVEDVKKGTGLGISEDHPAVGNVVKNIVTAKNKKKNK